MDLAGASELWDKDGDLSGGLERGVERVGELDRSCRRVARAVGERARDGTGGIVEAGGLDLVSREVRCWIRETDGLGAVAVEHARADQQHDQDDATTARAASDLVDPKGCRGRSFPARRPEADDSRQHRRRHRHKVSPRGLLGRLYPAPTFG